MSGENLEVKTNESDVDDLDMSPMLTYLGTEKGHEMASRVLTIFEDIKKATISNSTSHSKFEKWLQAGIILTVVGSSSLLTYHGKFDSTLGVLFGTLVGYLFGKR